MALWCTLTTRPRSPSSSPSTIERSHSGRERSRGTEAIAPARWPNAWRSAARFFVPSFTRCTWRSMSKCSSSTHTGWCTWYGVGWSTRRNGGMIGTRDAMWLRILLNE